MAQTLYRRPLPEHTIPFSSPEGRKVFAEALASGGLNGYFPLAEQFHTQSDPSFCGLGSLVMALNALAIDPERLWKGPWRWFAEDMLDCCVPLDEVRARGLQVDELACLARCNGAEVDVHRTDTAGPAAWRGALETAASGEAVVVASYDRAAMGQTGSGHFSPIGGYHADRDLALVLDVARFKYPPHWISAGRLWDAMRPIDPTTGKARGWLVLRRRAGTSALGFSVTCEGGGWQELSQRLNSVVTDLGSSATLAAAARAVLPLTPHLEVRKASSQAHLDALTAARDALRSSAIHTTIQREVGAEAAESVTVLLFALAAHLSPSQRDALGSPSGALVDELRNVQAQLTALLATQTG